MHDLCGVAGSFEADAELYAVVFLMSKDAGDAFKRDNVQLTQHIVSLEQFRALGESNVPTAVSAVLWNGALHELDMPGENCLSSRSVLFCQSGCHCLLLSRALDSVCHHLSRVCSFLELKICCDQTANDEMYASKQVSSGDVLDGSLSAPSTAMALYKSICPHGLAA